MRDPFGTGIMYGFILLAAPFLSAGRYPTSCAVAFPLSFAAIFLWISRRRERPFAERILATIALWYSITAVVAFLALLFRGL